MQPASIDVNSSFTTIEYVEYFVIGAQTAVWATILFGYLLGASPEDILQVPPILYLLLVPFIYILGMIIDNVSQFLLNPIRILIKNRQLAGIDCPDEFIGYHSITLYQAYEWRTRRARIPGSALVNWLFLGSSILLYVGPENSYLFRIVLIASAACVLLTAFTWIELYKRAYRFRRNACETIRENLGTSSNLNK